MAEGFTEERKKHALVLKDRKLLEINGATENTVLYVIPQ